MTAGLLVFSERIYQRVFLSVSAGETVDTAKVASSDVFTSCKHGIASHILDRDFTVWYLKEDALSGIDSARMASLKVLLFGDVFVRICINNAVVVKYFLLQWGEQPLTHSDFLVRPEDVRLCVIQAFEKAREEEEQQALEQVLSAPPGRNPG
jgi:hypothetical protein